LFIDYGHAISSHGNTLQAVQAHRFENPFENPGEADLTAHVDFENVAWLGASSGLRATPCVTQGEFLKTLGIEIRTEMLKRHATQDQALQIESGLKRLIAEDQMGTLFKVIGLCHDPRIQLAGF
jgi:NADH dehydrogenase [ubiquinone] 1 alpha subcomplex assembly factor 7